MVYSGNPFLLSTTWIFTAAAAYRSHFSKLSCDITILCLRGFKDINIVLLPFLFFTGKKRM